MPSRWPFRKLAVFVAAACIAPNTGGTVHVLPRERAGIRPGRWEPHEWAEPNVSLQEFGLRSGPWLGAIVAGNAWLSFRIKHCHGASQTCGN